MNNIKRIKEIKAIENHGKQIIKSDEHIKKDLNIDRDSIPLQEQNKIFNELTEERSFKFKN